jgi:hypothetical protein
MNWKRAILLLVLMALLLAPLAGRAVLAQGSENYEIGWSVIAAGGGRASSANYAVSGTAGQPAYATSSPSSANYAVTGGFWVGIDTLPFWQYEVFLPTILRH